MDPVTVDDLKRRIQAVFPPEVETPALSLRGGNALDDYEAAPPFDAELDRPTADYFERFHFGIIYLDPESWRFYLPRLLEYALDQRASKTSAALDSFLYSLRSPDQDPPRFATLSPEQTSIVVEALEVLGFAADSTYQPDALQALDEYWYAAQEAHANPTRET